VIGTLDGNDHAKLLSSIQKTWRRLFPGTPFVYSFVDQDFQRNYEKEQLGSRIIIYFTCIAILIACLGLFGLAAFSAEQRTKEIGIRKVLGASVSSVTSLLSKDFVKLIMIAVLIALPVAWYCMTRWLQDFEYQITIGWWIFVVAALAAVIIALITVSFQAVRAAIASPAKSLRSE
jgi:putative ABC transport system permease protein